MARSSEQMRRHSCIFAYEPTSRYYIDFRKSIVIGRMFAVRFILSGGQISQMSDTSDMEI